MRFSIIVPVYNVEKYIDKCMYTLTHQTFDNYEVIVVNDETPDNSMQIVEKYAQAFPGIIRMFHQKNTRQGGARNNGVAQAKGEYIMFVDSDDYVALNMLEMIDTRLRETPCDILVFSHVTVSEESEILQEYRPNLLKPGIYVPKNDMAILLLGCTPWAKAYRREFYLGTGMKFPEKILYEDAVTRLLYASAESVAICDDRLYYYVQSKNSTIRQGVSEKMLDILTVSDIVLEDFAQRGMLDEFWYPLESSLLYGILYILDLINGIEKNHPIQIKIADYIREKFPDYPQNPWVDKTLCRAMDYVTSYDFQKYHYRIRMISKIKEQILRIPGVAKQIGRAHV